jgi:hypothetical protein
MKLIVAIKPACRRPRSLIRHCFLPKGRQPREVEGFRADGHRVVQILNGMDAGTIGAPAVTARNLCGDVPEGRAPLRHVVISAQDTAGADSRLEAFQCLAAVAQDWIKAFAPHSNFLAVAHDDRSHPHIHLLVANADRADDDRRLSWSPGTVSEMQSLSFVEESTRETFSVESGRHRGVTRRDQGGMPYPHARLDALELAKLTNKQIEEHEQTGTLRIGRRDKHGQVTSVVFNGRRIRLSTIRHMGQTRQAGLSGGPRAGRNHRVKTRPNNPGHAVQR